MAELLTILLITEFGGASDRARELADPPRVEGVLDGGDVGDEGLGVGGEVRGRSLGDEQKHDVIPIAGRLSVRALFLKKQQIMRRLKKRRSKVAVVRISHERPPKNTKP